MVDERTPKVPEEAASGEPRVPPGGSLESTIRRDAMGQWFHDGVRVEHEAIRRGFDAWIERHENGRYVLKNDVNWTFVDIEGPPIFVRRVDVHTTGLRLSLSDGRNEWLKLMTLRLDRRGALYCQVREGRLTAQFSRQAMFDLEPVLDEVAGEVVIAIADQHVRPPTTETPIE